MYPCKPRLTILHGGFCLTRFGEHTNDNKYQLTISLLSPTSNGIRYPHIFGLPYVRAICLQLFNHHYCDAVKHNNKGWLLWDILFCGNQQAFTQYTVILGALRYFLVQFTYRETTNICLIPAYCSSAFIFLYCSRVIRLPAYRMKILSICPVFLVIHIYMLY